IGAAGFSLIAAISRQGMVYLPLLPILGHFFGLTGLVAAQPAAEIISLVLVLILVRIAVRRIPAETA
ncbi:MAG: MATE family efflux transporter, partial [Lachnospiraceae bacterium]